jgi:hypothetical protein
MKHCGKNWLIDIITYSKTGLAIAQACSQRFSPRRRRFNPTAVHVRVLVDKVPLGQVIIRIIHFSLVNYHTAKAPYTRHAGLAKEDRLIMQYKLCPFLHVTRIINKMLCEELIAYFPLIRHGPHRKRNNLGGGIHRQQPHFILSN